MINQISDENRSLQRIKIYFLPPLSEVGSDQTFLGKLQLTIIFCLATIKESITD